jgi:hypothetical protein
LRLAFFECDGERAIAVHDLRTGSHWSLSDIHVWPPQLSPTGAILCAHTASDNIRLFDSATGRPIADVSAPQARLCEFARDDAWALFTVSGEQARIADKWFLWRRGIEGISQGEFPGVVDRLQAAPDGLTAVIQCRDPHQLLLWDFPRGQTLRVLKPPVGEHLFLVCSPDFRTIAVWDRESKLEFIDVATGRSATVKTTLPIWCGAFSRDGALFYLNRLHQEAAVIDVRTLQVCWSRKVDSFPFSSPHFWMDAADNRLLIRYSNPFGGFSGGPTPTGALVLAGETGKELFSRPRGELSADHQVLFLAESATAAEAYGVPDVLLRWLPWIGDKKFLRLNATRIDTGQEVFRRAEVHPADQTPPWLHSPYYDRRTLVLMCPGRDTEIWDLPPAKRWGWIVGLPAAMTAFPWLWRFTFGKEARSRITPIGQPTA